MRNRILFTLALALALLTVTAAPAAAQQEGCSSVSFTLSPASGPPGTIVQVFGTGAWPQNYIDLYWETTHLSMILADTGGGFYYMFAVPPGASAGAHTITFDGDDNEELPVTCDRTFTVTQSPGQEVTTQPPVSEAATPAPETSGSPAASSSTLPKTGAPLLLAVGGLLLGGLALAALGQRRL